VASLAASFGRGAMTNHWIDLINTDVAMVMGSNVVENHPLASKWLTRAKERGAIIINCDPRFTRTSSFADIYCKLRSGTDIAFVNGIINYALQNDLINKDYVLNNTNASFIINEKYSFHDGLFSGYNPETLSYNKTNWAYELDETGLPKKDASLQHERCVFQLMKKHFERYDFDTVSKITGAPKDVYEKVCAAFTSTHKPDRVATWLYAMGTTQHTHGTQNIRAYAILQLLMGNIGLAGGGINALRGESNVQGSTDMALLFHILPGYLTSPTKGDQSLEEYLNNYTPKSNDPKSANWWSNYPKYIVSLLKAWYGDNATAENDFGFDYIPKRSGDYSHISLFEAMYEGQLKGLFLFGQNPVVGGPNSNKERKALDKLDWMVAVDIFETDTSVFWKRPGVDPADIQTEVFLLPACSSVEKEGSVVNSGRWAQWRYQAVKPIGESNSDLWIIDALHKSIKKEYALGGVFPDPITKLKWDYGNGEEIDPHKEPDVHMVAKEINGYFLEDKEVNKKQFKKGDQVPSFAFLQADGSTCSGNWLYCNSYPGPEKANNNMARRKKQDAINSIGLYPEWAWCWPVNRRIIYNRAAVDINGNPLDPKRWVIRWNSTGKKWEGDVPDGGWAPGDKYPFIMKPDGHAWLFASNLNDGPFPEHYEPLESPVNNFISNQQINPAIKQWYKTNPEGNEVGDNKRYPIVGTTYRVTEHWQAGSMTRNIPWLAELVPDVFVELGVDLAKQKFIKYGDKIKVETARGSIEAYALVTRRFQPFQLNGSLVHQIGVIWHFGYHGLATGDSANLLTSHIGDANTMIPEYKAFLCDIVKEVN
jgi:formate dehydrogenase major subunit